MWCYWFPIYSIIIFVLIWISIWRVDEIKLQRIGNFIDEEILLFAPIGVILFYWMEQKKNLCEVLWLKVKVVIEEGFNLLYNAIYVFSVLFVHLILFLSCFILSRYYNCCWRQYGMTDIVEKQRWDNVTLSVLVDADALHPAGYVYENGKKIPILIVGCVFVFLQNREGNHIHGKEN